MEIKEIIANLEPEIEKMVDSLLSWPNKYGMLGAPGFLVIEMGMAYAHRAGVCKLVDNMEQPAPDKNGVATPNLYKFIKPLDDWLVEQFRTSLRKFMGDAKDTEIVRQLQEKFPDFKCTAEMLALIQHVTWDRRD